MTHETDLTIADVDTIVRNQGGTMHQEPSADYIRLVHRYQVVCGLLAAIVRGEAVPRDAIERALRDAPPADTTPLPFDDFAERWSDAS